MIFNNVEDAKIENLVDLLRPFGQALGCGCGDLLI